MDKWINGASGKEVKTIIDNNFDILETRISQITARYVINFTTSEWVGGKIFIDHSKYNNKLNPCVDLYIKNNTGYSYVYGGYEIKETGIELQTDIPYEGRVVIR